MTNEGRGLALAVAAAFAAAILAISGHSDKVEQGYRLSAVRAEGEVLRREAMHAERRVSLLRLPRVAADRAVAMKLDLGHPSDRRTYTAEEVTALVAPPVGVTQVSQNPAPVRVAPPGAKVPPAGVMAR